VLDFPEFPVDSPDGKYVAFSAVVGLSPQRNCLNALSISPAGWQQLTLNNFT
jgi:Tol biopolymer transport system component